MTMSPGDQVCRTRLSGAIECWKSGKDIRINASHHVSDETIAKVFE
jgi:hypothetical protein